MHVDPNLMKYLIKARISADGVIEKPDVVGAIFGQSEGLLGEELDLRDLQKGGKIGRIEVEIDSKKGRTEGTLLIPSGLDQVESSILAAALETIDRVGPCKARIEVESIEDVRVQKRHKVVERAEELYKRMMQDGKGVSESIIQSVREEVERGEIISYGEDKLPAGPAIKDSESIIVVEGRSDVLNLLKFGIKNTIAVQGTSIPKTVQELSKERTVTVFLDGDRGGDLILKEMLQVAEIDFVARAPPGTEVEELTYKQVVKALRYKTPLSQYLSMRGMSEELKELNEKNTSARIVSQPLPQKAVEKQTISAEIAPEPVKHEVQVTSDIPENVTSGSPKLDLSDSKSIEKRASELFKGKSTEIYSEDGVLIASFPNAELVDRIPTAPQGSVIVSGGVVSQRLIDSAYEVGIKSIYGMRLGHITKKPTNLRVITWEKHS